MVGHYSLHFDARHARFADEATVAASYARLHKVTTRTFRNHRGRLLRAGFLVLVQAAAPGRAARYAPAIPPRFVADPGDLPTDLALMLGLLTDEDLYGPQPIPAGSGGPQNADNRPYKAEPRPVTSDPVSSDFSTVSFIGEGSFPLTGQAHHPRGSAAEHRAEGEINPGDRERLDRWAWSVLARCRTWWTHQRGPGGGLAVAEQQRLLPLLALALRRSTRTELIEALTWQTRSAEDLAAVVASRLWSLVNTRVPYDDQPVSSPALEARRAAARAHQAELVAAAAAHAEARRPIIDAAAQAALAEFERVRAGRDQQRAAARPGPYRGAQEPAEHHQALAEQLLATADRDTQRAASARREAAALTQARADRRARKLPQVLAG